MLAEGKSGGDRKIFGTDPGSGLDVLALEGRYGPYLQLGETESGNPSPSGSLYPREPSWGASASPRRCVGSAFPGPSGWTPRAATRVIARYGRYGPYISRGRPTAPSKMWSSCSPSPWRRRSACWPLPTGGEEARLSGISETIPAPGSRSNSGRQVRPVCERWGHQRFSR